MRVNPAKLNLKKIFGVQLFLFANSSQRQRLWRIARAIITIFCKCPVDPPDGQGILFFNSSQRRDYIGLLSKSHDACHYSKALWQLQFSWGFNWRALVLFKKDMRNWQPITGLAEFGFLERLFIYLFWIRCRQIGELADRIPYSALVVVCDIQLIDSFLVQQANARDLPTATLQHGLYIDDGPVLLPGNLNPANYLNSSARYFLAWGERTKTLIEAYNGCTCIVVGNPLIHAIPRMGAGDYFYVLTDADQQFRRYNQQLLEIAREYAQRMGKTYYVQFHPDNDPDSYGLHPRANPSSPLLEAAFAIGHMTSQMFIAMRLGVPTYRLRSSVANHRIPEIFLFSNVDDLIEKSVSSYVAEEISKSFIAEIGESSMDCYALAFDTIMQAGMHAAINSRDTEPLKTIGTHFPATEQDQ